VTRRPRPTAPPDLSPASAAAWPGLVSDLESTTGAAVVDVELLADLLRARDRLAQVQAVLAADGPTVSGSKGQVRPHPLLVTESVLRREIAQGLDRLHLSPGQRGEDIQVSAGGRLRPYD